MSSENSSTSAINIRHSKLKAQESVSTADSIYEDSLFESPSSLSSMESNDFETEEAGDMALDEDSVNTIVNSPVVDQEVQSVSKIKKLSIKNKANSAVRMIKNVVKKTVLPTRRSSRQLALSAKPESVSAIAPHSAALDNPKDSGYSNDEPPWPRTNTDDNSPFLSYASHAQPVNTYNIHNTSMSFKSMAQNLIPGNQTHVHSLSLHYSQGYSGMPFGPTTPSANTSYDCNQEANTYQQANHYSLLYTNQHNGNLYNQINTYQGSPSPLPSHHYTFPFKSLPPLHEALRSTAFQHDLPHPPEIDHLLMSPYVTSPVVDQHSSAHLSYPQQLELDNTYPLNQDFAPSTSRVLPMYTSSYIEPLANDTLDKVVNEEYDSHVPFNNNQAHERATVSQNYQDMPSSNVAAQSFEEPVSAMLTDTINQECEEPTNPISTNICGPDNSIQGYDESSSVMAIDSIDPNNNTQVISATQTDGPTSPNNGLVYKDPSFLKLTGTFIPIEEDGLTEDAQVMQEATANVEYHDPTSDFKVFEETAAVSNNPSPAALGPTIIAQATQASTEFILPETLVSIKMEPLVEDEDINLEDLTIDEKSKLVINHPSCAYQSSSGSNIKNHITLTNDNFLKLPTLPSPIDNPSVASLVCARIGVEKQSGVIPESESSTNQGKAKPTHRSKMKTKISTYESASINEVEHPIVTGVVTPITEPIRESKAKLKLFPTEGAPVAESEPPIVTGAVAPATKTKRNHNRKPKVPVNNQVDTSNYVTLAEEVTPAVQSLDTAAVQSLNATTSKVVEEVANHKEKQSVITDPASIMIKSKAKRERKPKVPVSRKANIISDAIIQEVAPIAPRIFEEPAIISEPVAAVAKTKRKYCRKPKAPVNYIFDNTNDPTAAQYIAPADQGSKAVMSEIKPKASLTEHGKDLGLSFDKRFHNQFKDKANKRKNNEATVEALHEKRMKGIDQKPKHINFKLTRSSKRSTASRISYEMGGDVEFDDILDDSPTPKVRKTKKDSTVEDDRLEFILTDPDSPFATLDFKTLFPKMLQSLTRQDREELAQLLPPVDRVVVDGRETIRQDFTSLSNMIFWESVQQYQTILSVGGFQKKEETAEIKEPAPYKDDQYEEYWGERLIRDREAKKVEREEELKQARKRSSSIKGRGRGRA